MLDDNTACLYIDGNTSIASEGGAGLNGPMMEWLHVQATEAGAGQRLFMDFPITVQAGDSIDCSMAPTQIQALGPDLEGGSANELFAPAGAWCLIEFTEVGSASGDVIEGVFAGEMLKPGSDLREVSGSFRVIMG